MDSPIKKNREGNRGLFSSMVVCSLFAHLFLFYLMTFAYSSSIEKVDIPQVKAIKGYLISKAELNAKEVKEIPHRTTLPAPEYVPEPPKESPAPAPLKIPKEAKKESAAKTELLKPKPDEKKEKEQELKKKALEEIKKKLSQPKALPVIAPQTKRPAPRPENFPLPEGFKETKKATLEIPLPEGSASAQAGADVQNEMSKALARYSEMVKNKILNNFSVSYKKPMKDYPSGEIVVEIDLDFQGNLKSSHIIKGSGFDVLDDNCTNAIQRGSPFPEIPEILRDEPIISFVIKFPFSELAKYITKE